MTDTGQTKIQGGLTQSKASHWGWTVSGKGPRKLLTKDTGLADFSQTLQLWSASLHTRKSATLHMGLSPGLDTALLPAELGIQPYLIASGDSSAPFKAWVEALACSFLFLAEVSLALANLDVDLFS
jgi:hypothetical protein